MRNYRIIRVKRSNANNAEPGDGQEKGKLFLSGSFQPKSPEKKEGAASNGADHKKVESPDKRAKTSVASGSLFYNTGSTGGGLFNSTAPGINIATHVLIYYIVESLFNSNFKLPTAGNAVFGSGSLFGAN